MKIADFHEMSPRARAALRANGLETLEQAAALSDAELLRIDGFAESSLGKLRAWEGADDSTRKAVESWSLRHGPETGRGPSLLERKREIALDVLLAMIEKAPFTQISTDFPTKAWSLADGFFREEAARLGN